MRFYQNITLQEDLYGDLDIHIVVTDNFDELFTTGGDEINIFEIGTLKKDADLKDSLSAVDELKFNLNHAKAINEADENVIFFTLQARDVTQRRYVGVFINDTADINEYIFLGQVDSDIDQEDFVWNNGLFDIDLQNISDYSFAAFNLGSKIIEDAKTTEEIKDASGNAVDNIFKRLKDSNFSQLSGFQKRYAFSWNLSRSESVNNGDGFLNGFGANDQKLFWQDQSCVFDIFNDLLSVASSLLLDLFGLNITLEFLRSDLSFKASPSKFIFDDHSVKDGEKMYPIKLGNDVENGSRLVSQANTSKAKNIVIDDPNNLTTDEATFYYDKKLISTDFSNNPNSNEVTFTLESDSFKSIADIFYAFAEAYGCTLKSKTYINKIEYWFEAKSSANQGSQIFIIGADSSGIGLSNSIDEGNGDFYHERASNIANGGEIDEIRDENWQAPQKETDALNTWLTTMKEYYEKEHNQKLIFPIVSTSRIFYKWRTETNRYNGVNYNRVELTLPVNLLLYYDGSGSFPTSGYFDLNDVYKPDPINNKDPNIINKNYPSHLLSNATFMNTVIDEPEQLNNYAYNTATTECFRPVASLHANVRGEDKNYYNLSTYLNDINSSRNSVYEKELELNIPFINGFADNNLGANPSWKNLELFKTVNIGTRQKVYNQVNAEWEEGVEYLDYLVTSIEIDFNKLITKVKLQSNTKYPLGDLVGTPWSDGEDVYSSDDIEEELLNNYETLKIEIASGMECNTGDAISLKNGKAERTVTWSSDNQKIVGISANTVRQTSPPDSITVVTKGLYSNPNFNFQISDIGKFIYAYYEPNLTTINLTTNVTAVKYDIGSPVNKTADLFIRLGKIVAVDVIDVNPSQARLV
jgi:hypothetical protein